MGPLGFIDLVEQEMKDKARHLVRSYSMTSLDKEDWLNMCERAGLEVFPEDVVWYDKVYGPEG